VNQGHRRLLDQIRSVVRDETRYLRHYIGQVIDTDDELTQGRVAVAVIELGWDTAARAAWCWPRQVQGLMVPAVGQWVEVYFVGGDRNRPVYLGLASEVKGHTPESYVGPDSMVVFADPDGKVQITYDRQAQTLLIAGGDGANQILIDLAGGKITIGDSAPSDSARKGDATTADVTTDPTNFPFLTTVCAIFGMTLSKIDGKITGGSAQVKVGG
jgi:hypothetical protein